MKIFFFYMQLVRFWGGDGGGAQKDEADFGLKIKEYTHPEDGRIPLSCVHDGFV